MGGFVNIKINNALHDLLVLEIGLVLVSEPSQAQKDRERLTQLIDAMPLTGLIGGHWFIRYDEIAHAQVIKHGSRSWTPGSPSAPDPRRALKSVGAMVR